MSLTKRTANDQDVSAWSPAFDASQELIPTH